jgi:hypothetical protein
MVKIVLRGQIGSNKKKKAETKNNTCTFNGAAISPLSFFHWNGRSGAGLPTTN